MWQPAEYLKFANERARPFFDLLAQVEVSEPPAVVDLGCGPGTLTKTLCERWPKATVVGVDSSPEMLAQAQPLAIVGRLTFVEADIADWSPDGPVDLIVSNAALHWVKDHERLLARLAGMLAPRGTLAVQLPGRFESPSQLAVEAAAGDPRWAAKLEGVGLNRDSVKPIDWYVRTLRGLGLAVNAWETTYIHVLSGENPVLAWMRGTALRPLLSRLSGDEVVEFERQLAIRLTEAYPPAAGVTLFPFRRLFFVAVPAR